MTKLNRVEAVGMPQAGSVLGVDVGYSPNRPSSAVCRLDWDTQQVSWKIKRFRALSCERENAITAVAGNVGLEAAAFDGPLRTGFDVIGRYCTAERMLTRRLRPLIGKPGQASAPVGKALNSAANDCVKVVLEQCELRAARHAVRIDAKAVVEAFPNSFLGVMLRKPADVKAPRGKRSDIFFEHLRENGELKRLLDHLLPGRMFAAALADVVNHDDRAALICALTALSVAASDFTAVGDDADGWIVLPPVCFVQSWARSALEANTCEEVAGSWRWTTPNS